MFFSEHHVLLGPIFFSSSRSPISIPVLWTCNFIGLGEHRLNRSEIMTTFGGHVVLFMETLSSSVLRKCLLSCLATKLVKMAMIDITPQLDYLWNSRVIMTSVKLSCFVNLVFCFVAFVMAAMG